MKDLPIQFISAAVVATIAVAMGLGALLVTDDVGNIEWRVQGR